MTGRDLPGPRPGYYPPPPSPDAVDTRRASRPALAQQQLMARISATRKARQQRTVIVVCTLLSVVVLLVATGTWALSSYINGHVARVSAGAHRCACVGCGSPGVPCRAARLPSAKRTMRAAAY